MKAGNTDTEKTSLTGESEIVVINSLPKLHLILTSLRLALKLHDGGTAFLHCFLLRARLAARVTMPTCQLDGQLGGLWD